MDYRQSGVDICRADKLVEWLKIQSTNKHHRERIIEGVGGYASLFQIQFPNMKEPCLASSTDGVGTKLKLALRFSSLRSLGQDLVAMCTNDLLCVGAKPLFFLDYYACGQLNEKNAKEFLMGIKEACDQTLCALVGGETAEMPGIYNKDDFDCAGFAVGVVDRSEILGGHRVQKGSRLVALPSQGFHSNGYSLLRKVFESDLDQWANELLKPTALYTKVFQAVLKGRVQALAHITGGGLDNILRVVPSGSQIYLHSWPLPQPFLEVKKRTQMNWEELVKTLNCGVGLVAVVDPSLLNSLMKDLKKFGVNSLEMGEIKDINENSSSSWKMNFDPWDALL